MMKKKHAPTFDLPFKANSVLLPCIVWIIVYIQSDALLLSSVSNLLLFSEIRFNSHQHLNYCNPCCPQPSALRHTRVFFLFFLMLRCCHLQLNFCTRLSSPVSHRKQNNNFFPIGNSPYWISWTVLSFSPFLWKLFHQVFPFPCESPAWRNYAFCGLKRLPVHPTLKVSLLYKAYQKDYILFLLLNNLFILSYSCCIMTR